MTKFLFSRADGPWDYPNFGFRAAAGAILNGAFFTPPITLPPDVFWTVYTGASSQTGITLIPGANGSVPSPYPTVDGYILTYQHSTGGYIPESPADWLATDGMTAALSATYASHDDIIVPPAASGNSLGKVGVILTPGGPGTWDETAVEGLNVVYDHESGKLAGVYVGYQGTGSTEVARIGIAYSDDGVAWVKKGILYTASGTVGAGDEGGVTGPVLVYENGLWHLFYIGLAETGYEGGTHHPIMLATSPSLTTPTWTRRGKVMEVGGTGWRQQNLWHASPVKHEGEWYCFMNASRADFSEVIGYAKGGRTLLDPWVLDDVNSPLLVPGGPYEGSIIGDPQVRPIPGGYRMDYYAVTGNPSAGCFYATTSYEDFPLGWVRGNDSKTILSPTESYDSIYAHKALPFEFAGRLYLPYTSVGDDQIRRVALAVDPPFAQDRSIVRLANEGVTEYAATINAWAGVGGFAKTLKARVGQWIEMSLSGFANNGDGDLRVDAQITVDGVVVGYASGGTANHTGFSGLGAKGGVYTPFGGTFQFSVLPIFLKDGQAITIVLVLRADGAARSVFTGNGAQLHWSVKNLG